MVAAAVGCALGAPADSTGCVGCTERGAGVSVDRRPIGDGAAASVLVTVEITTAAVELAGSTGTGVDGSLCRLATCETRTGAGTDGVEVPRSISRAPLAPPMTATASAVAIGSANLVFIFTLNHGE